MTELTNIQEKAKNAIEQAASVDALEAIRVQFLGKKGELTEQMKQLGSMSPEDRKSFGQLVNQVKNEVSAAIESKNETLSKAALQAKLEQEMVDITLPVRQENVGKVHPISQVIEEVTTIFGNMGFAVADGPEIEDDFHNFTALNIPPHHPAREMQDTFYLQSNDEPLVLRTHTSSMQIRYMEKHKPPYRIIASGRVYRSDSDQTHAPMFHQVEGLYVDKDINMGHLKGCIINFLQAFFERDDLPTRFRPSYFPFTEPSAEVDIGCSRAGGEIALGEGGDWLEVLGCGMVHPNVLRNVGVDPAEYQGFAFGVGIERIAMLKYGISDLRTFFDPDIRWLDHYGFNSIDIPNLVGGLSE